MMLRWASLMAALMIAFPAVAQTSTQSQGMKIIDAREFVIYFDAGDNSLTNEDQATVADVINFIDGFERENLPLKRVIVVGRADASERSLGDTLDLSKLRAWHVADALVNAGVPASQIAVDWKGDTDPVTWPDPKGPPVKNQSVTIDFNF